MSFYNALHWWNQPRKFPLSIQFQDKSKLKAMFKLYLKYHFFRIGAYL